MKLKELYISEKLFFPTVALLQWSKQYYLMLQHWFYWWKLTLEKNLVAKWQSFSHASGDFGHDKNQRWLAHFFNDFSRKNIMSWLLLRGVSALKFWLIWAHHNGIPQRSDYIKKSSSMTTTSHSKKMYNKNHSFFKPSLEANRHDSCILCYCTFLLFWSTLHPWGD